MNHLAFRSTSVAVVAFLACAIPAAAMAGGGSKTCRQCGGDKHVKQVCRLVKFCERIDVPSYVYSKEEVFYPDKGSVCHTGYRCDTFYDFWRTCDCAKGEDAAQQAAQHGLPGINCSSYTVCGCKKMYGAKPTGCHTGSCIRVPGKTQRVATPILKWETVPLCKDCCEKSGKER